MNRAIGAACLVVGILLLVWGHDTANAFNSQVENIFTGTPTDRAMYFYIGGAALTIFGLFKLIFK